MADIRQPHITCNPQAVPLMGTNQGIQNGTAGFNLPPQAINYNHNVAKGIGITQMVIGIICIVFNITMIAVRFGVFFVHNIGYGIWGGVVFFIAGLLSFHSGKGQPKRNMIIFTMLMDIIAACLTPITFTFGMIDVGMANDYKRIHLASHYDHDLSNNKHNKIEEPLMMNTLESLAGALSIIIVILSIVEVVVSIIGSGFCYKALCCSGMPLAVPLYFTRNQRMVYNPNNIGFILPIHHPCQNQPIVQLYNYVPSCYPELQNQIPQVSPSSDLPSNSPPPKYEDTWNMEAKSEGTN